MVVERAYLSLSWFYGDIPSGPVHPGLFALRFVPWFSLLSSTAGGWHLQATYPEAPMSAGVHLGSANVRSWEEINEQKKGSIQSISPLFSAAGNNSSHSCLNSWFHLWPVKCFHGSSICWVNLVPGLRISFCSSS